MDYKYIEQLLERYWECQTTLEEETILRNFFAQEDVPASLLPYRDVFAVQQQMADEAHLGEDFDQRMEALIGEAEQTPRLVASRATLSATLRPLYKAASAVAVVLTICLAAQHGWTSEDELSGKDIAEEIDDSIGRPELIEQATAVLEVDPIPAPSSPSNRAQFSPHCGTE